MKIKLVLNGFEQPEDYKLLQTTLSTVASVREQAVLRFTKDRLVIISTPKLSGVSSNNVNVNNGQLWCTIPNDVFKCYFVSSLKDRPVSLEVNCNRILSVLKRYDKALSQGSITAIDIRLQEIREWKEMYSRITDDRDVNSENREKGISMKRRNVSPIYSFTMRFQETIRSKTIGLNNKNDKVVNDDINPINKTVIHKFMIPVKRLLWDQDTSLKEPVIHVSPLVLKLPSSYGEFGRPFQSFLKRIGRYSNVKDIQLNAITYQNGDDPQLFLSINQVEWDLSIQWNGPLDVSYNPMMEENQLNNSAEDDINHNVISNNSNNNSNKERETNSNKNGGDNSSSSNSGGVLHTVSYGDRPIISPPEKENRRYMYHDEYEEDALEDSEMIADTTMLNKNVPNTPIPDRENPLKEISRLVEQAEEDNKRQYSVKLKPRDWKVCTKLYTSFDQVLLAIAHDQCCILHCSLEREPGLGDEDQDDENSQIGESSNSKERGQIIYYMLKSKSLQIS